MVKLVKIAMTFELSDNPTKEEVLRLLAEEIMESGILPIIESSNVAVEIDGNIYD